MADRLGIEDVDDISFQRSEWTVQRFAWVGLAVFLAAAVAGLFSVGPLSATTARSPDGALTVSYDRFLRHVGITSATVVVGKEAVHEQEVTLFIAKDLARGWDIENVVPHPSTESSSGSWLIYQFDVLGGTPPRIRVSYRGDRMGLHRGAIRVAGGSVDLWQFTYP